MATAYISTNTEISLVNTLNQSLTLFLPLNTPNGRNLYVKDAAGNCANSTITLRVQGSDTFEDGSVFQTLNSAYESMQYMYNSNIWYFNGGTMLNTYRVSTLNAQNSQIRNLSSGSISVSTFQISDFRTSTIGTFNTVSSFLLYNGFNIGGGLRTAIPQGLNRTTFSPRNIPNLVLWLDAADPFDNGTVLPQSTLISNWVDKSFFRNNAFQTIVGNQPNYNTNSFVNFNGSNAFLNLTDGSFVVNTSFSVFLVEQRQSPQGFIYAGRNTATILQVLHFGYRANTSFTFAFFGNDLDLTVPAFTTVATEPFRIWSLIYTGAARTIYLNGSLGISQNFINNLNANYTGFIGSNNFGGQPSYNGNLREIIYTKPSIDGFQRQQVEGYLAWKYGLQTNLPASHPFRNAPPQ